MGETLKVETSSLRLYESELEKTGMSQLVKTQMLQVISEQQSAQGDRISATALQAIRAEKAAKEAAEMRSKISTGLLVGAGLFSLVAGASALPGANQKGNPLGELNASWFRTGDVIDNKELRKIAQQASSFYGQGNSFLQTSEKIVSTRHQATQTELRADQQAADSEKQKADSDAHRKQSRRDQVDSQISQQESQEFTTKKAIVTGS